MKTEKEIVISWSEDYQNQPLVSICCLAFNHENFISQTIKGFLSQETNFPFEILINEDASTDNTAEIIQDYASKYPRIIKPLFQKTNQYKKGKRLNPEFNFIRAVGKYIATCEGDDYWIDNKKLQKQIEFLEQNPDTGLSFTYARSLNTKTNRFNEKLNGKPFVSFDELILENTIPTLTAVFRKDIYNLYEKEINPSKMLWKMGDYPTWLFISMRSKVHFIPEITGVYRILKESMSHSTDCSKTILFNHSVFEIRKFFIDKYSTTISLKKVEILRDRELVKSLLRIGRINCAINQFYKSKHKIYVLTHLLIEFIQRHNILSIK